MVAASVFADGSSLRVEPWLPQPESGGIEPGTWLAIDRAGDARDEQIAADVDAALEHAARQRARLAAARAG